MRSRFEEVRSSLLSKMSSFWWHFRVAANTNLTHSYAMFPRPIRFPEYQGYSRRRRRGSRHRPKPEYDRDITAAFFALASAILLAVAEAEPRWLLLKGGRCSGYYIGLYKVIAYKSAKDLGECFDGFHCYHVCASAHVVAGRALSVPTSSLSPPLRTSHSLFSNVMTQRTISPNSKMTMRNGRIADSQSGVWWRYFLSWTVSRTGIPGAVCYWMAKVRRSNYCQWVQAELTEDMPLLKTLWCDVHCYKKKTAIIAVSFCQHDMFHYCRV